MDENIEEDQKALINKLYLISMIQEIMSSYVFTKWRWLVFDETIDKNSYNLAYVNLMKKHMGVVMDYKGEEGKIFASRPHLWRNMKYYK